MMVPRSRGGGEPESPPLFSLMRLAPESANRVLVQAPGDLTPELNQALVSHARDDERASRLAFPEGARSTENIVQTISLEEADVLLAAMLTRLSGLGRLAANTVAEIRDAASARTALLAPAIASLTFCLTEADYYTTHPNQG